MSHAGHVPGLQSLRPRHLEGADAGERDETVVIETPVALLYNGDPFAVMMATPVDLADFALGFALSEGVVATPAEFALVDTVCSADGISLHAAIPQARFDALGARRRNVEGRSGCGLCGVESLRDAMRPVPRVDGTVAVAAASIHAALSRLSGLQPFNAASGGVHAAAFASGDALLVREDVGRHNALDKVIGAMARAGEQAGDGFLLATSRASYEIVHKAATAGIPVVVAISAPTDLAVRIADAAGVTLVAFARGAAMNIYTHPQRIQA